MKKNYFLIALVLSFTSLSIAQNTVTVDASAVQNGYANVFETPANGGGYLFGTGWGVEDLKTVVDAGENNLTLQPNFNTYADNPGDDYWIDPVTLLGNKIFEGNTFIEDNSLIGSALTFEGNVTSNTLDGNGQLLFNVNNGPLTGGHPAVAAGFGGVFTSIAITEDAVLVIDDNAGGGTDQNDACEVITNGASLDGKIAIIRRGACAFTIKVLAAQNEGAIAVIMVNNAPGEPIVMGGDEPAITIPALMVSDVVGEAIIAEVAGETVNTTMVLSTYATVAFIKVFNADFSVLKEESVILEGAGTNFSVIYTNVEAEDAVVQYGFQVKGLNANPSNETTLGSVVVAGGTLGVNDFNTINVSVYPNPTTNNLNIQSDEQIMNIAVYNTLGQMVNNTSPNATNFSIETANLDTGMYFAILSTEKGSKTVKFIKQ
tara:strand:+ start:1502 stop:2794 length:1293 start_codon:yes stop_codon:yes gene_type:complete